MAGYPVGWDPATGLGMPPEFFIPSTVGQASSSASQTTYQQVSAAAPQPTQQQDSVSASQPMLPNASAPQPSGNVSAFRPTPHQQSLATLIQPMTPTKILVSRLPHRNGVNWVFHDPTACSIRHVNVPYLYLVAQQQVNQGSPQANTSNKMVLYQQPSNQITQHATQIASDV